MAVNLSPVGGVAAQFFTNSGAPLTGGKIFTYAAGTTTPQVTYTTVVGNVAHPNPIILDAAGRVPTGEIWLTEGLAYKFVTMTSTNVLIGTYDNISGIGLSQIDACSVTYDPPFSSSVSTEVCEKLAEVISVKDFGAVGNGVVDDTQAIKNAVAAVTAAGGGELYFPRGSYVVTSIIDLPTNIVLSGVGRRKAYPGVFLPGPNTLATVVPTHTGRCCFRILNNTLDANSNVQVRNLNVATLGIAGSAGPIAAFGFECGQFQRDFTFDNCGIHGFTSAFDVYRPTDANVEMGVIKILNCSISLNNWIARTLDGTHWNSFVFMYNEAGQNGYEVNLGGISIGAFAAVIVGNLLEGQRDAVKITGLFRGLTVQGNYFEANVGRACIELKDVKGPWFIGANNYSNVNDALLQQKVYLGSSCGPGLCLDPYWPELVYKTPPAILGNDSGTGDNVLNGTFDLPFARVDSILGSNYSMPPISIVEAKQRVTIGQRSVNPQTGRVMPVQQYTTIGAGAVSLTYSISANIPDDWIVVSWLFKQEIDASANTSPYISLNVNGTSAAGSRDFPLERFGTYFRQGEWALVTVATKVKVAVSSVTIDLYPHGLSPASGRVSSFLRPVVYVVDSPNKIIPYVDNYIAESCASAPTVGTWQTGDQLLNSAPAAGQASYVCSSGGTPGTWVFS